MQHTTTHCNTMQHTTTHCNTMQHTTTHGNTWQYTPTHSNTIIHVWVQTGRCDDTRWQEASEFLKISAPVVRSEIATHYNVLQHTVTHGTTLHRTPPTHSQHTPTHWIIYDSRNHIWFQKKTSAFVVVCRNSNTIQHVAAHNSTLQHTATHGNTLLHTATHCNTLTYTWFFFQKKKRALVVRREISTEGSTHHQACKRALAPSLARVRIYSCPS